MSILIKGMTMPTDCIVCPFGWSACNYQHDFVSMGARPSDCPLVSVPPHGRLIDADAFRRKNQYYWSCEFINPKYGDTLSDLINAAPTVIEAEEAKT